MPWQISGTYYAPCSCNVGCPCTLGEMQGDRGWCSGTLAFDIRSGRVDGTDVSNTRVVLAADWPSGFLAGNGTGRLYFDEGTPQERRTALEPVLMGQRGGVLEAVSSLVPTWLPARTAPIRVETGDEKTRIVVGDYGEVVTEPLKGATGERTRLLHAAAAFRDDIFLGRGTGTRWRDPDLRQWESGGHSEYADFDWSG